MTTLQAQPAEASPRTRRRLPRPPSLRLPRRLPLPRAPKTRPVGALVVTWMLVSLSVLTAWTVCYALFVSTLQAGHEQGVLYSKFREQLAMQTAPLGGRIEPGAPVALLSMKGSGLRDEVIVEGTAPRDLMRGPGHRRDSPLPGQAGVSVLYGRSALFGGPFKHIAATHLGDQITVITGQGTFSYTVQGIRRAGDPYPLALASGGSRLTLVTAESNGWRGGWAPSHAVYVDAALDGQSVPAPSGRVTSVPKAEKALHGDVSALVPLVLWFPVLAVVAVACVWAFHRWGRWQAWIVGFPVLLGTGWAVSQCAVQLLPNLM